MNNDSNHLHGWREEIKKMFQHRGLPDPGPPIRSTSTTTGLMLLGPWHEELASYPPRPPKPYQDKDTRNFKLKNQFSAHDNRHSFQDHGVYFGDGQQSRVLGKRSTAPVQRQHFSNKDYLKHEGRTVVNHDYHTIYGSDFRGKPTNAPDRRRFPRQHSDGTSGLAKLTTKTTSWRQFDDDNLSRTPLQVLAVCQEPFLPANSWRYSYHGTAKCYPPYERAENKYLYPSWAPAQPHHQPKDTTSSSTVTQIKC